MHRYFLRLNSVRTGGCRTMAAILQWRQDNRTTCHKAAKACHRAQFGTSPIVWPTEPLSRRRLSQLLATVGLTAVTVPLVAPRAQAAEEAVYFTWSGYDDPGFFPDYVKKHGANPNMPIFPDEEEALQKLRAGFVADVVHPCNSSVGRWNDAGVVQPLDTSRLSHWSDLFESLTTIANAQLEGKQYFVPIDWGNTSIIYRPDLVDITEEFVDHPVG